MHAAVTEHVQTRSVGGWFETFTGRRFWALSPDPHDVDIRDIAHGLSLVCRFTGQCREFYSVAEHSVRVMNHVRKRLLAAPLRNLKRSVLLTALLHDAPEAYISDLPSPIKRFLPDYQDAEARVQGAIFVAFGIGTNVQQIAGPWVKYSDTVMVANEANALLLNRGEGWAYPVVKEWAEPHYDITPWEPRAAEQIFLQEFEKLTVQ